jgi:hypothetical protein
MNLYKVSSLSGGWKRYILAVSPDNAIVKYIDIEPRTGSVVTEFICKRDQIIPTVEPTKELIK